jgi:hypothetical protein
VPAQCDTWCKRSTAPKSVSGPGFSATSSVAGYCTNKSPDEKCALHTCTCLASDSDCGALGAPCCKSGDACTSEANECGGGTGTCVAKGSDSCGYCGATKLTEGNQCCADKTQGRSCCGKTALRSGNVCCTNATQGASCCGGTALRTGYTCCSGGIQSTDCAANPWAGNWAGPVWNNCINPFQSGLMYHLSVVSEGVLFCMAEYGAGPSSGYFNYSGNTAQNATGTIKLILNSGGTPPSIDLNNAGACMHGTLVKQ